MITNQPKSSQIGKRTQDKAKVSLLHSHYIFFAFKINQFFQYFLFSIQILTKSREFEFPGLACQWSPYSSYSFTRSLQRWIKVRFFVIPVYVNLLHSGAFVAYSGVVLVSFLFVAVSFQLVAVYSGTILVHSGSFRNHSGSFPYIPVPFLSIPFHSAIIPVPFLSIPFHSAVFRYIPFRFIPFLCLVTPVYIMFYNLWQPCSNNNYYHSMDFSPIFIGLA